MIKVSVLYPNHDGKKFDMKYYCEKHMPMVRDTLGAACKGIAVEEGGGGPMPGSRAAYIAMGHVLFESRQIFQSAFPPHAAKFMADIPNYTDIEPTIQISDV